MRQLIVLLVSFLLLGCAGERINHCDLLDAAKIESMCNVSLHQTTPGDGASCDYINDESTYIYAFSNISSITTTSSIGEIKSEYGNMSIDVDDVDFADGATYDMRPFTLEGRIEGYGRIMFFERDGDVYMVEVTYYGESAEDDPTHCSSKEGLIALASEIG